MDEVADFKKFASDRNQPNPENISGNVLETLNGIRDQKQFRIREVIGPDGFPIVEFHAKHLSTTHDWGESVPFLRYVPTSSMWVAPQMALKCVGRKYGKEEENDPEMMTVRMQCIQRYSKNTGKQLQKDSLISKTMIYYGG